MDQENTKITLLCGRKRRGKTALIQDLIRHWRKLGVRLPPGVLAFEEYTNEQLKKELQDNPSRSFW